MPRTKLGFAPFCFAVVTALSLFAQFAVAIAAADDTPSPPNILFIIADDASAHFGAYGCSFARTPNIDRVASEGLRFDRAYTPTAKCAPSRAAILTGRNPWQLEEAANHQSFFPAKFKAVTEVFNEAGIYTGAQGKFWGPGQANDSTGKPRTWGLAVSGGGGQENDQGVRFRKFLSERPKGKPFFFWFGSNNPHRPYVLDSGTAAGKSPTSIDKVPGFFPDTEAVRRDMLDYSIEIETFDAQIGSLLRVLEETGEADRTLVMITSDHGMPFPRIKGHNYEWSNHVPLIMRWPSKIKQPGRAIADFVSLIDLAPTMLDVMKLDPKQAGMETITGSSLTDLFETSSDRRRDYVLLGRERNDVLARPGTEAGLGYPVRAIREGNYLFLQNFAPDRWPCGNVELGLLDTDNSPTKSLIANQDESSPYWQWCFGKRPAEELFDVTSDRDCIKNLADDPSLKSTKERLRKRMTEQLTLQADPRILGQGDLFDQYPTAKKAATNKKK